MKKLFCLLIPGCLIAGCSKSSTAPAKTTTKSITGNYALYRIVDTTYTNGAIASITTESELGDTTYVNPGASSATVEANTIAGYDPAVALADTLEFTSVTAGTEIKSRSTNGFTFKIDGPFTNPGITVNDVSEVILVPNNTTITILKTTTGANGTQETTGYYYLKF